MGDVWSRRPSRGTRARGFSHCGVRHGRVTPRCSVHHSPEASNPPNPSSGGQGPKSPRRSQAAPVRRTPVGAGFVRVDTDYDRSLARPEPASLFKRPPIQRLQDMVQIVEIWELQPGAVSDALRCPPLVGSPTCLAGWARRIGLAAAFRFSAKFICMGK